MKRALPIPTTPVVLSKKCYRTPKLTQYGSVEAMTMGSKNMQPSITSLLRAS